MLSDQQLHKQIAGPSGFPIIGSLVDLARDPLQFVTRLQSQYGDIVQFSMGPAGKTVLVSHPDHIDQILLETGKRYSRGNPTYALKTVLGNGLVTSEGDFWKRQRKLAAPAFHHQSIRQYAELMVSYTHDMLRTWQNGAVRDVYEDMMFLTQRIIMKALFDVDMLDSARTAGEAFDAMMHGLGAEMNGLDAILPDFVPTPSRTRMKDGVDYINGLLIDLVEQRRAGDSTRHDLLTMLMNARDDDDQPMTLQQMLDEIRTLYLAGHETTANTLSWAWLLLSRNPAAYDQVQSEVESVLSGRPPTAEDVPNLPYCNAVIKEALRCYPTAWIYQRMTLEDVEIAGYPIPKDTNIWISPWVVHHDERWYPQPQAFMPERWLKDKSEQPPRQAYIPFGGGPRICIGNGFAMMEGVLLLATILQQFRVAVLPDHPIEIGVAGTIRPKFGLRSSLTAV